MTKIRILVLLLMWAGTVDAQTGSSRKSEASPLAKKNAAQGSGYQKEERVKIEIDQIPDLLRLTLEQGKQYRGWHNAIIYVDKSAHEYIFHITDSSKNTKTFWFNEEGKDLTEEAKAAQKKSRRKKPTKG